VLLERATNESDNERQPFVIDNSDHPRPDQALENRLASRYFVSEAVAAAAANTVRHREASQDEEIHLLTIRYFEPNVRVRIGGLVTARSVKYLGNLASSLLDQETRDSWWNELRDEIRYDGRSRIQHDPAYATLVLQLPFRSLLMWEYVSIFFLNSGHMQKFFVARTSLDI